MTDPLDGRVEVGSEPHHDLPEADLPVAETVYGVGYFAVRRSDSPSPDTV